MDRIANWTAGLQGLGQDMPDLQLSGARSGLAPASLLDAGLEPQTAPPDLFQGKLGIGNFEIRYAWDGATSQQNAIDTLAQSKADLLIMGAQYQVNAGTDVDFTKPQIQQIEATGTTAIGYMSIGAIVPALDRFDSLPGADSFASGGVTYLKYWDPAGVHAYNPDLLQLYETWVDNLAAQGFDGAFLDVMDSYVDNLAVDTAIGGASKTDDYLIATTALLNIVKQLGAYDAANHPGFKLVLGHNPYLIEHYYHPGDFDNPDPDQALVEAVQNAVDGVLVENQDFRNAAAVHDIVQNLGPGSPYNFGDATLMAAYRFPDATFTNGDAATREAFEWEIAAARDGYVPYGAPSDHYGSEFPPFNLPTAGPNALLAEIGGSKLNGLAGDDVVFGQDGRDRLYGGSGNDELNGGGGKDLLVGGGGHDDMTGGAGADTFAFLSTKDSAKAKAPDHITDLTAADTIDLKAIDADINTAGDQAFHQVAHFTHHAGELVLSYSPGSDQTLLRLDVDGDGKADMSVTIDGDQSGFTHFVL